MSNVKIYTAVSEDLSPLIQGEGFCTDMVRYSDYAALEDKCAALAAENAALKSCVDGWCDMPATDAFLAEVRAQGVEMVIAYHRERAEALHHVDRNNAIRRSMAALDASDVAAQLRQNAKTENHSMLSSEDCQAFVQAFTKGSAS